MQKPLSPRIGRNLLARCESGLLAEQATVSRLFALIDEYVSDAFTAAARNYDRLLHGACPADKRLGAWLPASAGARDAARSDSPIHTSLWS